MTNTVFANYNLIKAYSHVKRTIESETGSAIDDRLAYDVFEALKEVYSPGKSAWEIVATAVWLGDKKNVIPISAHHNVLI